MQVFETVAVSLQVGKQISACSELCKDVTEIPSDRLD
jgi:hypothetical protein